MITQIKSDRIVTPAGVVNGYLYLENKTERIDELFSLAYNEQITLLNERKK